MISPVLLSVCHEVREEKGKIRYVKYSKTTRFPFYFSTRIARNNNYFRNTLRLFYLHTLKFAR